MHILAPQAGRIDDGDEAVDLGQDPANILILSAADSELSALCDCVGEMGTGAIAASQSVRLANLMALNHPYSIDLYIEKTARHAKIVMLRILGGAEYWRYGLEEMQRLARGYGLALLVMPGDDKWDADLASWSSQPMGQVRQMWRYFAEGGVENLKNALAFAAHLVEPDLPAPPQPKSLPRMGVLWDGDGA